MLFRTGRTNEALRQYEKAISLDPNNDIAYNSKGYNFKIVGYLVEKLGRINEAL